MSESPSEREYPIEISPKDRPMNADYDISTFNSGSHGKHGVYRKTECSWGTSSNESTYAASTISVEGTTKKYLLGMRKCPQNPRPAKAPLSAPVPKKRELKSNQKIEKGKSRTLQTCLKELLRDFRNYYRDAFLADEAGRHNHIVNETKIERVKDFFVNHRGLPNEMFE